MLSVGRRRTRRFDLPPLMHEKRGRYYYGRNGTALGDDFAVALRKYAEIHTGHCESGTFADAARVYLRDELRGKAPKTQDEYERQLALLVRVFGRMRLDAIVPGDIRDFLIERSKRQKNDKGKMVGGAITATREKALFSAVFNFARGARLTNAANPCAGMRGKKSHRDIYVTDEDFAAVIGRSDPALAAFLEMAWRTGADASVVLKLTRADQRDGALWVQRTKTGAKTRIDIEGPLQGLLERLTADPVRSVYLISDHRGQPISLQTMRKRFIKARKEAGASFQIRDLRAKAGSDAESIHAAQALLGHADESTTAKYRRKRIGERAKPIMRVVPSAKTGSS